MKKLITAALMVFVILWGCYSWSHAFTFARITLYQLLREINIATLSWRLHHAHITGNNYFRIFFLAGDEEAAELVLRGCSDFWQQISRDFAHKYKSLKPAPVVIHPTRQALNAGFAWPGGEDDKAIGIYWAGVINVLSPRCWPDEAGSYLQNGPLAHELTHLAVDYITKGNCPRWLSEGLAQYEEFRLTGFRFPRPQVTAENVYQFSLLMNNFDQLTNQQIAYWQALSLVEYFVGVYGWEEMLNLLQLLGKGMSFTQAIQQTVGTDANQYFLAWQAEVFSQLNVN